MITLLANSDKKVVYGVDKQALKLNKIEHLVCSNKHLVGKPKVFFVSSYEGKYALVGNRLF